MAAEITPSSGEARELSTSDAVHTLIASFLGWMLDAFDFFILVFVPPTVAKDLYRSLVSHLRFGQRKSSMVLDRSAQFVTMLAYGNGTQNMK